jgi:flavin reductase (DIM6/NTAB) family NADH-FMN oxidoreductase RutF
MKSFLVSEITQGACYNLLFGGIAPRPVGFISTVNLEGQPNLAPFSSVQALSSAPPFVCVSFVRKSNGEFKDTLRNIRATKEFVVNSIHEEMLSGIVKAAAEHPSSVNEFSFGFTQVKSDLVKPPRVGESKFQLECRFHQEVALGTEADLVIGEVLKIHIDESAYDAGRVNSEKLELIGRLGGPKFCKVGEVVTMKVPTV